MTMTRTAKTGHAVQMRNASEHTYTSVRFSSPRLIRSAKADRGHDYMSGTEYRAYRMGRGERSAFLAWELLMSDRGYRSTESGRWIKITRK